MKKLITTTICSLFLLVLAFGIYSQRTNNRPANEWWIYYLDGEGNKHSMMIETTYPDRALAMFRKLTTDEGEMLVTCMTNTQWNYCIEREY